MGLDHYLFAFYVFTLICVIAVICKYLFSDVKRQRRMLDETERKLLRTYQSLEDVMDEFYDAVAEAKADIEKSKAGLEQTCAELQARLASSAPELTKPAVGAADAAIAQGFTVARPRGRSKAGQDGQVTFEQLFNGVSEKTGAPLSALHENVLDLSRRGRDRAAIAKELKITLNEVDLVIGMSRDSHNHTQ